MNKPIVIRVLGTFAVVLGLYDLILRQEGNTVRSLIPIALGLGAIAMSLNKGKHVA